jgi:hypothetical protein
MSYRPPIEKQEGQPTRNYRVILDFESDLPLQKAMEVIIDELSMKPNPLASRGVWINNIYPMEE